MKKDVVLIASDHAGFGLKEKLKRYLAAKGIPVEDLGTAGTESCDYPVYAYALAKKISAGRYKRGILVCYSGIGNSIVANRLPGVRASLCYDRRAAQLTREHNDSNVLVLGAGFVGVKKAQGICDVWLKSSFQGGRHRRRLNLIRKIEKELRR
ncbi:MAG: ribose 5-phosphate isomerase B [Candidatus Omnitrophica bacterium]|nr:ribose 5-phosphate isomerase B [Candidatus Omnitrophota bacterium]